MCSSVVLVFFSSSYPCTIRAVNQDSYGLVDISNLDRKLRFNGAVSHGSSLRETRERKLWEYWVCAVRCRNTAQTEKRKNMTMGEKQDTEMCSPLPLRMPIMSITVPDKETYLPLHSMRCFFYSFSSLQVKISNCFRCIIIHVVWSQAVYAQINVGLYADNLLIIVSFQYRRT